MRNTSRTIFVKCKVICFIFRLEDGQTGRDRGSGTATDKYSIQAEGSASQDAEQTNAGE